MKGKSSCTKYRMLRQQYSAYMPNCYTHFPSSISNPHRGMLLLLLLLMPSRQYHVQSHRKHHSDWFRGLCPTSARLFCYSVPTTRIVRAAGGGSNQHTTQHSRAFNHLRTNTRISITTELVAHEHHIPHTTKKVRIGFGNTFPRHATLFGRYIFFCICVLGKQIISKRRDNTFSGWR